MVDPYVTIHYTIFVTAISSDCNQFSRARILFIVMLDKKQVYIKKRSSKRGEGNIDKEFSKIEVKLYPIFLLDKCSCSSSSPNWNIKTNTVKLGWNEHLVMTKNFFCLKLPFYSINQPGYNDQIWPVPSCSL